jgi:di/tricarboxylate transporter
VTPQAWFVGLDLLLVVVALATNRVAVDVAMVGGLTLLLLGDALMGGIVDVSQAMAAFSNPALVLIGALFIVAAGLTETGAIEAIAQKLLGMPKGIGRAQSRLMLPVALLSGFMNNTPIVAMYLPIVQDWAKRMRFSPSQLLIPLSYAAILGGKLTLIGTASNVVLLGLYEKGHAGGEPFAELSHFDQFWGIAWLGVPTTLAGVAFIIGSSKWLLPKRATPEELDLVRQYHVRMLVGDDSPVAGKTIQEAGLRTLPGLFLSAIERDGESRLAAPGMRLQVGDLLAFVGELRSVIDLRRIRGLTPLNEEENALPAQQHTELVEAVVARGSSLEGRSAKDSGFRAKHNAAIVAVHRDGEALGGKIGEIVLRAGDTLLLESPSGTTKALQSSRDFYLASSVANSRSLRHDRAPFALGVVALLIILLTVSPFAPAVSALTCAGLMVVTGCLPSAVARSAVQWTVLVVIGSALVMGVAVQNTGLGQIAADAIIDLCGGARPELVVLVVFLATATAAQLITSNGAAVLMFEVGMIAAKQTGVGEHAMLFTLMVGAGSTFVSPVAYQTNLMVYGPGGYRFTDFVKIGLPLTFLLGGVCALLAPRVY